MSRLQVFLRGKEIAAEFMQKAGFDDDDDVLNPWHQWWLCEWYFGEYLWIFCFNLSWLSWLQILLREKEIAGLFMQKAAALLNCQHHQTNDLFTQWWWFRWKWKSFCAKKLLKWNHLTDPLEHQRALGVGYRTTIYSQKKFFRFSAAQKKDNTLSWLLTYEEKSFPNLSWC